MGTPSLSRDLAEVSMKGGAACTLRKSKIEERVGSASVTGEERVGSAILQQKFSASLRRDPLTPDLVC